MFDYENESAFDAFYSEGLITDVLRVVRSGKEATVYCCAGTEAARFPLVAAKVYRAREHRNFSNAAVYQPGRERVMKRRERVAIEKKSTAGRKIQFGEWINAEFETMRDLYAAGASVPEPIHRTAEAMLMEFIGDESADAPMLMRVRIERGEAEDCLRAIVANVATMLSRNRVHGDLSAYNILYSAGRPIIIDFPQAVDARFNPNARALLDRDLENVCGYFTRMGIRVDACRIAADMWRRYRDGAL